MDTARIRGIAVTGAAVIALGGASFVGVTAARGSSPAFCGTQGASVKTAVAARRHQLQQVVTPLLPGVQVRTLVTGGSGTLDCAGRAESVAPAPVSGEVQQPAWLVREMAGGPPHCAVV